MKKYFGRLGAMCLVLFAAAGVAHAYTGAIFTTLSDGTSVNANIYDLKADVYLNGGPQNQNSAGLPDGFYFFQVTNPSGSVLLSTDDAVCRQLQVAGGVVAGPAFSPSYPSGCLHAPGTTNIANGSTPVQLIPFLDTPNNGGEYKVWLIAQTAGTAISGSDARVIFFTNPDSKTDNFKVLERDECVENCELTGSIISGTKFYDTNGNGYQDAGEPGIPGWKIVLFNDNNAADVTDTTTDGSGDYSFLNVATGDYGVCEILPDLPPPWVPTTSTIINGPYNTGFHVPPDSANNDFGNVCLGTGGGLTLGFWSNKNGQALFGSDDLALMVSLNLRNANGSNFDPGSYNQFRNWLLSANATNMAYMLSAQLAAMELNVNNGKVNGGGAIFIGAAPAGCNVPGLSAFGFITVNALMNAANSGATCDPGPTNCSLAGAGLTVAAGTARSCQEFMKTALDKGNNNLSIFVLPPGPQGQLPCDVNYTGNPPTCVPSYSTPKP